MTYFRKAWVALAIASSTLVSAAPSWSAELLLIRPGQLYQSNVFLQVVGGSQNAGIFANLAYLDFLGHFANTGSFRNYSTTQNQIQIDNAGEILNFSEFNNLGKVNNLGTFTNFNQIKNLNDFQNLTGGTLTNLSVFHNFQTRNVTNSGIINNNLGATFTNDGTLTNSVLGQFNNTGTLNNRGLASLENSGQFENSSGGVLNNDGKIDNKISGNFTNNGRLNNSISGRIENNGLMTNNQSASLINNGRLMNTGVIGRFVNKGSLTNSVFASFINEAEFTNQGVGATFTNEGRIENRGAGSMTLEGRLTNNGIFENRAKVTVEQSGEIKGSGTYRQRSGELVVNGSMAQSEIEIEGGVLSGTGEISGDVTVDGAIIDAGQSPGLLTFHGNLDLVGGTELRFEIGGTIAGSEHDQLDVLGIATIESSTLFGLDYYGGYTAGAGDFFDLLVADEIIAAPLTDLVFDFGGIAGLFWEMSVFTLEDSRQALRLSASSMSVVPLPASVFLFGSALFGIFGFSRWRRRDGITHS